MNSNDEMRRRITRSDSLYIVGVCLGVLVMVAVIFALVTFSFLIE